MGNDLVGQDDDGHAVFLRQVEGKHGDIEAVANRRNGQHDDGVIAVGPPAGLHHIPLGGHGGKPRAGPAPHHVHDDAGRFGHAGIAEVLLHQRKAGPAGGRHGLHAGQRCADDGPHAGNLILHLDEAAAQGRELEGHVLGDLGGGGDGIAGKESASRGQRPFGKGFVSLEKQNLPVGLPCIHDDFPPGTASRSCTETARSGQCISQNRHPMHSSGFSTCTPLSSQR